MPGLGATIGGKLSGDRPSYSVEIHNPLMNKSQFDLYLNWLAIDRSGVTINLRGNVDDNNNNIGPSDEAKEKAIILVGNGWNVAVNGGLT